MQTATVSSPRLADYLSPAQMRPLLARSDLRAAWMTAVNLGLITAAFALPAIWLNPLTLVLAVLLLGGRQMGLGVLYHECAHHVLFRTKRLNDLLGAWVYGGLMNTSLARYRAYHLQHHRHAGTKQDPDLVRKWEE